MENSLPAVLPLLRVNEIQESDITDVVSFFETPEEITNLDLGALGTGTTTGVASSWDIDSLSGSTITFALDPTQIDGPLMNVKANTMSEAATPMFQRMVTSSSPKQPVR